MDMIYMTTVYQIIPGAKFEVTEVVDLMTALFTERSDLREGLSSFQARWLDNSHFALSTVYRNSSAQAHL